MLKKIVLVILLVFTFNGLFAQEKSIKIFNEQTGKEIIIQENKRIKIKTSDGVKISGRFTIFDDKTIILNNEKVSLSQIEKIKKNPLFVSILTKGILYFYGAALAGVTLFLYAFTGDATLFLVAIPSALLIYGGIKSPNILKGYKVTSNWNYEIVTTSK